MKSTNINDSGMKDINRKLTYKFTLNGEELPLSDIMDNLTITYDCGAEQYSIGNVYIGELQLTVKNTVSVGYKDTIKIEIKQDGIYNETRIGTFYVHSVEEQGLTKQIKAYDGFYKLNVGYFPIAKHTSTKAIMEDIAKKHNIVLTSTDGSLGLYKWTYGDIPINNEQLEGKTVLEMLSLVACVHGGSFILDGYGFLKLVQPSLEKTSVTFTESEYLTPTLDNITTYNITKLKVIYGEQVTDDDGSIKDTGYYEVGSGTDTHTLAISNPLLKGQQAQARTILNQIKAMNGYKRFDTTILLGDYRLEPMDVIAYVKDDTTYKVPIIYMQIVLSHNGLIVRTQSPTIAESKKEFSFKGTITQKIDNVYTDMMQVKEIVANTITVGDLNAINAKIENLEAQDATISNLVANKANINDLNATNANIENLKAKDAEIENLVANKADIEDLNATNANIGNLNADIATINTLLAGNITSENIQSGSITSDRLVIDDGFVKDAMIDTVNANKILAGRLDTGAITIGSEDGKMLIADETIQISDGTNVRVQIGETASGDYALVIWDENGEVMFDATGITESAIKDAIIKDDMISDTANINAQKIDINSLFTAINEDGSHTLNSSKIFLDTQQQTLNVAFNNMTTKQGELQEQTNGLIEQTNGLQEQANGLVEKTEVLTTELNVQSGKIETLIQNTTIIEDGKTINLKDKVSSIEQDLDGITLQVGTVESNITNITDNVTSLEQRVSSAELKVTEDAIVSTVTKSQVFKDAVEANGTTTGSRNYILNSNFAKGMENWERFQTTVSNDGNNFPDIKSYAHLTRTDDTFAYCGIYQNLTTKGAGTSLTDKKWSLSCWYYAPSNANFGGGIRLSVKDNSTGTIEKVISNIVRNKWTRITCSGELLSTPVTVYFELEKTGEIYVTNFQLEQGLVATDWSPSPTDFDNELNGALTRIETSETKIEQNAQAIALRATKKELEAVDGKVTENTEKIGELKVSTDGINAIVKNNTTKIDENTTKIGELEVSTDNINLSLSEKATKEELTNVKNGLDEKITTNTEKISQIEMDIDGINLSVSETNKVIEETSIGIRNLLRNSAFIKGTDNWEGFYETIPTSIDKTKVYNGHPSVKFGHKENHQQTDGYSVTQTLTLGTDVGGVAKVGEQFTLSGWYYCEDASTFVGSDAVPNFIRLMVVGSPVGDNTAFYHFKNSEATVCVEEGKSYGNSTSPIVIGKWTKIETTFKIDSLHFGDYITTEYDELQAWISVHGGGIVWFTDVMLTRGNKAPNEWIASPEDTTEAIDAIEQQVVTNTQSIASLMINADSISASVQRVEQSVTSSLDGMNQNITSLTNRVDATMSAEDIKFEISKELQNGTNKVSTSTGFTFDESGLTIDKSDSEMSTNINENGMIITKNNETVLTANNKGVQAKNLYATTYLIVGNSRFESYRSNRTGCFYVFEPSIEMTEETNLLNEEGEE